MDYYFTKSGSRYYILYKCEEFTIDGLVEHEDCKISAWSLGRRLRLGIFLKDILAYVPVADPKPVHVKGRIPKRKLPIRSVPGKKGGTIKLGVALEKKQKDYYDLISRGKTYKEDLLWQ